METCCNPNAGLSSSLGSLHFQPEERTPRTAETDRRVSATTPEIGSEHPKNRKPRPDLADSVDRLRTARSALAPAADGEAPQGQVGSPEVGLEACLVLEGADEVDRVRNVVPDLGEVDGAETTPFEEQPLDAGTQDGDELFLRGHPEAPQRGEHGDVDADRIVLQLFGAQGCEAGIGEGGGAGVRPQILEQGAGGADGPDASTLFFSISCPGDLL